jgi:PAS domain S-box-containing protein
MCELNITSRLSQRLLERARQENLSVEALLERWLDDDTQLKKNLSLFRIIADHTTNIIALFDPEQRYLYINKIIEEITGQSVSTFIGKTNRDLGQPEELVNQWEAAFRAALQTGEKQIIEYEFPTPNGQRFYQSHITPMRADDGSIEQLLGVTSDITKRKREQMLRESEERYRIVSDLTFNYACSFRYISENDDDAQLEWVIGAFERITGHTIEEALSGFSLSNPVHPDDKLIFQRRQSKLHSGQDDISEFRIFDKDNNLRWLRSYGRPEWDDEHKKVVRVYIGVQDITDQKLAEEKLAHEHNLLDTLIHNLPEYIYVKDTNARFLLVNKAVARHLGAATVEEVVGKTDFDYSPRELAEQYTAHDAHLLRTGQSLINHEELIFDHLTDGFRWIITNKIPLRDSQNKIIGLVGMGLDITGRKLTEIKMAQLAAIVETSADAIISRTLDGIVTSWNAGAERLYGYSVEEALGNHVDKIIPADYKDDLPFITGTIKQGERIENYETVRVRKDGKRIDISLTLSPITDGHGNIVEISAIGRDISERKQAERRFRTLLESAPDAMVIVNAEGKIVLVNTQTEKHFGYARYEILGKSVELLIPEHQREQHPKYRDEYTVNAHTRQMGSKLELYGQRKDGSQFPIEVSLSPIETTEGTLIASAIRDITERKQAEAELREKQHFIEQITNASPLVMYVYDLDEQRLAFANRPIGTLLGYTEKDMQVMGKDFLLQMLHPEERPLIAERMARFQTVQDNSILESEIRFLDSKGETHWLFFRETIFLRHADGSPKQVLGVTMDITENKRIQQEVVEAQRRAEEASQLKSQFLATMSHELRTPLNAIIGFSDVMLNGILGEMTVKQQEYVQGILDNGEHLLSLINDVLDVSKIEAGQFELSIAPLDLAALLTHVHKRLNGLASAKGLQFKATLDPAMPPILDGDERRLKQILINLISNAVKFTEQGSVEAHIDKVDDSWWTISITDTGIGIPPNALTFLFEEFRQVDNSLQRRYEGTGLGLAIVRRLVTLMGGTIRVASELGKGSTFTVQLPLVVSEWKSKEQSR